MKVLVDENVSWRIAERLQLDGQTVIFGQHVAAGKPDHEVLALASNIGAVVVTEDNDFGDLVIRQHSGIGGCNPAEALWHGSRGATRLHRANCDRSRR